MGNLFFKVFISIFLSLMMLSSTYAHHGGLTLAEFNLTSSEVADGGFTNESFVAIKIKQQEAEWMVNSQMRELKNWTSNSFSISGLTYIRTLGPTYQGYYVNEDGVPVRGRFCWLTPSAPPEVPCTVEGGADGTQFSVLQDDEIIVEVSSDIDGPKSFVLKGSMLRNSQNHPNKEVAFSWVQQANPATAIGVKPVALAMRDITSQFARQNFNAIDNRLNKIFREGSQRSTEDGFEHWVSVDSISGDIETSRDTVRRYADSETLTVGIDRYIDKDRLVGAAFSYGKSDVNINGTDSEAESNNVSFLAYLNHYGKNINLESTFGVSFVDMETRRVTDDSTYKGDRDALQLYLSGKVKAKIEPINNINITPFGKVMVSQSKLKAFNESQSHSPINFKDNDMSEVSLSIGADFLSEISFKDGTIKPYASIEYVHDLSGNDEEELKYLEQDDIHFLNLRRDASGFYKLGLGLDYEIENLSASFNYQREEADGSTHFDAFNLNILINL